MNWITSAFWAHVGWVLGEVALYFVGCLLVCIAALATATPRIIKQHRCKHKKYHETMSCDAVCDDCGKNLGFIGVIRDGL